MGRNQAEGYPEGVLALTDFSMGLEQQNFRKVRYLNMTFNTETLINAGRTFLMLFGELFGLFIGISFVVALLQVYIS